MKTIAVPVSHAAAKRLDLDAARPGDLHELHLDSDEFRRLWQCGVLQRLNVRLGTLIDDFEDESIVGRERLSTALEVLEAEALPERPEALALLNLFRMAHRYDTGVYFFF